MADLARQFEHQAERQLRGRMAERLRSAHRNVPLCGRADVDGRIAHARRDDQLQVRQRIDDVGAEQRAFAHQADHCTIFKRRDDLVRPAESLVIDAELDVALDTGPIGHRFGHVLIVVEDGTLLHVKIRPVDRLRGLTIA